MMTKLDPHQPITEPVPAQEILALWRDQIARNMARDAAKRHPCWYTPRYVAPRDNHDYNRRGAA